MNIKDLQSYHLDFPLTVYRLLRIPYKDPSGIITAQEEIERIFQDHIGKYWSLTQEIGPLDTDTLSHPKNHLDFGNLWVILTALIQEEDIDYQETYKASISIYSEEQEIILIIGSIINLIYVEVVDNFGKSFISEDVDFQIKV